MSKWIYPFFIVVILIPLFACAQNQNESVQVSVGAEILLDEYLNQLSGKRIGLALNPTSRIEGVHLLDTLLSYDLEITALFAAEHGFRGNVADGEVIANGIDSASGLPVFSLYQSDKRPTKEMLKEVDIILFDMQDVGGRFYTYYQTLFNILEEADKAGVEVWVLDRPNPAGGEYVQGWILEDEFSSFVGKHPMPMVHGMTLGELSSMAIGEQWIEIEKETTLKIIEMKGWERSMNWSETNLDWVAPSPNLPSFKHAFVYLGTVLFEGASVSEGRGTDNPFLTLGSPTVKHNFEKLDELAQVHNVKLDTILVTPRTIPGIASNPKFDGQEIKAVKISDISFTQTDPMLLGLDLLLYFESNDKEFRTRDYLNLLAGVNLRKMIEEGFVDVEDVQKLDDFKLSRKKYLIYN